MKTMIIGMLVSAFGLAGTALADQDCTLAQRYIDLSRERRQTLEFEDAITFLQHAIDACPSYEAYQTLGDLQSQSPKREDQAAAVDALVAAYQVAPSETARATALLSYARVLNQNGDPSNAYPVIKTAQALDAGNDDINQLASQIEQRVNNPTKETLRTGIWNSLYKPLPTLLASSVRTTNGRPVNVTDRPTAPVLNQQPADFLPINFETGTTLVDAQTRSNVRLLAQTLADPDHKDQHFVFVGHADIRGSESNNVILSKRRAEAIYQSVTLLEPSLQGRIEVTGKGSAEPIDLGTSEESYRRNRRLQVLLQ